MLEELQGRGSLLYSGRCSAELCPTVVQKAELISDEFDCLVEENFQASVRGVAWFLIAAYTRV